MAQHFNLDVSVVKTEISRFTGIEQPQISIQKLAGDASAREYFRVFIQNWHLPSVVLMAFEPQLALTSEEFVGKNAVKVNKLPFLVVQEFLYSLDLPVPQVYLDASKQGRVWLEDLGDNRIYELVNSAPSHKRLPIYKQILDLLVEMQSKTTNTNKRCELVYSKRFDFELLRWELDHFREWMIEEFNGIKLSEQERKVVDEVFDEICHRIEQLPYLPVHRDFQSKNLFLHRNKVYMIDFQDMLIGPVVYDLVALLRDSYVVLTESELDELLHYYHQRALDANLPVPKDFNTLTGWFFLLTLHRKMKDSGRFVFIDRVKNNPSFLQYIPDSLKYVRDAFAYFPEFKDAQKIFAQYEKRLSA